MIIYVNALFEVKPKLEPRAPSTLELNVSIDTHNQQKLFYDIWEYNGDSGLNEWLKAEGYQLTKLNSELNPEPSLKF